MSLCLVRKRRDLDLGTHYALELISHMKSGLDPFLYKSNGVREVVTTCAGTLMTNRIEDSTENKFCPPCEGGDL